MILGSFLSQMVCPCKFLEFHLAVLGAAEMIQNTLSEFGCLSQIVNIALSCPTYIFPIQPLFLHVVCVFDLLQVVFILILSGQYGVQSSGVRG